MRTPRTALVLVALTVAAAFAVPALCVTVDGSLDPEYGPPLATQTRSYGIAGPYVLGIPGSSGHSELDELYGFVADGVLHLFVSGNLLATYNPIDPGNIADDLRVFIDCRPGGQNVLATPSSASRLTSEAGLRFGTGFAADYEFDCRCFGNLGLGPFYLYVSEDTLSATDAVETYLGAAPVPGSGTLSGGTNPLGVLAAIDNGDTLGVSGGCGTSSGAGATRGVELAIPLAAIGSPSGCIRVFAYADRSLWMTDQALPPAPNLACYGQSVSTTDFSAMGGAAYVTACAAQVPARKTTWGSLKRAYR